MKIVIISDLHGNFDALSALQEDYDQLWVLGDLVNYGPQPAEVIAFVRKHATHKVRGNHDHCIGFGEDARCSRRFREMADATRKYTDSILGEDDKKYLRGLPLQIDAQVGNIRCRLCHAVPSDPLFMYCQPDSDRWAEECRLAGTEVLLVGHTHIPFSRQIGNTLVVNPGSLGQPKSGAPRASYAVLKDGRLDLRSFAYPVDKTAEKIRAMPISVAIQEDLITVLRTGAAPEQRGKD
ncbi:MAG: metallophosphoesterase family protein [Candidatus Acidiferrales bacterium]